MNYTVFPNTKINTLTQRLSVIVVLLLLPACASDAIVGPGEEGLLGETTLAEATNRANTSKPVAFGAAPAGSGFQEGTMFPPAGGSSLQKRGADYVSINVNTTGLPAGAYTAWWIVFNNPDACVEGCDGGDLGIGAVEGSVLWATGGVVGHNGTGHFRATLEEGIAPGQVLFGPGLVDAGIAEVHVVIRYHGPVIPERLQEQTTTVGGGCDVYPCFDPQAVPHARPQ